MRRMYSVQELTRIIGEVFDQKLESGALDSSISDAVDAYLVEHPVDITALEGQTISPAVVHATTSIDSPSGSFTALEGDSITGDSIIENMSGYSLVTSSGLISNPFISVCKNGNKLTFAYSFELTLTEQPSYNQFSVADIAIPAEINDKLVTYTRQGISYVLCSGLAYAFPDLSDTPKVCNYYMYKSTGIALMLYTSDLTLNQSYLIRIEQTFLLSDNLVE